MYLETRKVLSVEGETVTFEDNTQINISETAQKYSLTEESKSASELAEIVKESVLPELKKAFETGGDEDAVFANLLEVLHTHSVKYGLSLGLLQEAFVSFVTPARKAMESAQNAIDRAHLREDAEKWGLDGRGNSPDEQLRNLRVSELKYLKNT
jgi:hypothetical protein